MATYRKRNGRWQARVRRYGLPSITKTFPTKNEATIWARLIESEIDCGSYVDRTNADITTLGDILKRYKQEISPHKKSFAVEAIRIDRLLRDDPICSYKASALSGKVLAKFRDGRLKQVSGSTVNRELNLISHAINVARKEWGIHMENPVSMIHRPKNNKSRDRRLSNDEFNKLFVELELIRRSDKGTFTSGGTQNPWIKPIVLLALETAMRRGEIISLRWTNINLDIHTALIPDTKNGEARIVPLSSKAVAILQNLPRPLDDRVFPVSDIAIGLGFRRACKRAGLEDFHFHDLRHEATSRLIEKLPNILELSAVTGHKDLRMLKRYYHPRAEDLALKLG